MRIDKRIKDQKKYFESISSHYIEGNEANINFLEKVKKIISPWIKGDVLDIGSGGLISYDIGKTKSLTLADIASGLLKAPKILEKRKFRDINSKKIKCLEASVLDLPFEKNSFDMVLMINVAHHLSESSKRSCRDNVKTAIREIYRVLRPEGQFIMIENCPSLLFKLIEDFSFEIGFNLLSKINKPLPFFFSEKEIEKILTKSGFKTNKKIHIPMSNRVYLPIFPFLSPPGWLWEKVLNNTLFLNVK